MDLHELKMKFNIMDVHSKQNILRNCNDYTISLMHLDKCVEEGFITIQEFKDHNLEISKVKELERKQAERNGIVEPIIIPPDPDGTGGGVQGGSVPDMKQAEIQKVLNGCAEADANIIIQNIQKDIYSYDDLMAAGISQSVITSLKFFATPRNVNSYTVDTLPPMESGRTDVFFIGVPASGKSTMLGGFIKYARSKGKWMTDSYNNAGNVYADQLKMELDRGVLPKGTVEGSYNYIAASLKDDKGINHPLNIVEVAGENYKEIYNNGIDSPEVKSFVRYIKNSNKKILIFVIDSLAHERRLEQENFSALDQSAVYENILTMFRDHGVLEQTRAVYLVANKFDAIKKTKYMFSDKSDLELATDFLETEFINLINNFENARKNSRNKFEIVKFPYSVGEVIYDKILSEFNPTYAQVAVENILQDSFVVKGGSFWKKTF